MTQQTYVNNITAFKFLSFPFEEALNVDGYTFPTIGHALADLRYTNNDTLPVKGVNLMMRRHLLTVPYAQVAKIISQNQITNTNYHKEKEAVLRKAVMQRLKNNPTYMEKLLATGKSRIIYAVPLDTEWGGKENRYGHLLEEIREDLRTETGQKVV